MARDSISTGAFTAISVCLNIDLSSSTIYQQPHRLKVKGQEPQWCDVFVVYFLVPNSERNMLNATWTALRKSIRCFDEMNLKLTAWTIGHTFQDPWHAFNRSLLILSPITEKESPLTNPKYVKKTVMKMGHQTIWSKATFMMTCLASFPSICLSSQP
jgi:hypothetical protein